MRTKVRSKFTLLLIVCAVLIAVPGAAALAQDTGTPAAPTIQSDKDDYAPGELVTLTGSGWQPGESVHINVDDDQTKTWSRNVEVTADGSGNITDSFNLPDWFVATYKVTATGAQSGTVTTSFTDANPNALTVNPTSVTVTQGTAAAYSVTVQMGGNANQCTTTLSASGLPSGASATFSGANPRTGNTNYTSTMTVSTTGVSPGSHPFSVNMTRGSNCQGMGNLSQPATLVVNSAVTTTTVSNITTTDSTFGGTTDLSAKVSPAGAPGSVKFFVNGSSTPASGTVNYNQSTGVATLSNYAHGLAASNTAYSVKAVFTPTSGSNYSASNATNTSALTVNKADTTTTVSCGAGPFTYNGAAHTPCSAEVTGPGGLSQSLTVSYQDNTNAGQATASASFAGNGNYNASSDTKTFTIQKADTTTTVTCDAGPFTYNGSVHTPCSASVSGPGGFNDGALTVNYTNNVDVGQATASASFAGNDNYNGSSDSKNFTIEKASSTTTVECPAHVTYDGSAKEPCSAKVTGVGGLNENLTVHYTDNTNAGTAHASATFAGDANHNGSDGQASFEIDKASSTTEVTCPASVTYDSTPKTPCTVSVTGAGGLNLSPDANYTNNTNAGTASASYTYAGDANHTGSQDSKNFTIEKAATTTTVTCPASVTYNGLPHTPCSAKVTGPGGLDQSLTVDYQDNTNAGTAKASASYAGNGNYNASQDSKNFTILKANQTITFAALSDKIVGAADFNVSATANSGLPVSFAASPNATCTISGNTVHIAGVGTCTITASQAGNDNYNAAPNVSQTFKVTYNFGGFLQPINYTAHQVLDTNVSTFKGGAPFP